MNIRKIVTIADEILVEMGEAIQPPSRRAAAIAVIANPLAERYQHDLSQLIDIGAGLGEMLTRRALEALGVSAESVESYGKAAIVGEAGEIEHAAAILHPKLGGPMRAVIGGGAALVPSAKKRATMGAPIDVPLGHHDAAFVRGHFDAMEVRVPDAPRPNEIMVVVVLTDSGRPLARVGGLAVADIQARDGLR